MHTSLVYLSVVSTNCGPEAWNSLPSDLHDVIDTKTFKTQLKCLIARITNDLSALLNASLLLVCFVPLIIVCYFVTYFRFLSLNSVWSEIRSHNPLH